MSSTSPSPDSPPSAVPPASPSNSSATPPPPTPSAPPPRTPPPPAPPQSPPPAPATSSPPPPPPTAPPPPPPAGPPPSPPAAPPPSDTSPPPPILSPPPPRRSPPPVPPATPPPSPAVSPSPPPPVTVPPPPSITSPPPLPENSPPPPALTPPPAGSPSPPLISPPPSAIVSPPPPTPSSLPPVSPPSPSRNTSTNGTHPSPPLPNVPTGKPTVRTTPPGPSIAADGTSGNKGGMNGGAVAAVGVIAGILVISLAFLAVWLTRRRKRKQNAFNGYMLPSPFASSQNSASSFLRTQHSKQHSAQHSGQHSGQHSAHLAGSLSSASNFMYSPEGAGVGNSKSWFTYEELSEATYWFSADNLLGEGGFGCVYKGILTDGREVAVKQLKIGSGQGEREFRAEVEIISRVHHRHLVSLVGYCISERQRLLVYEFVPNDTLHYHLHGQNKQVMDWATRVKVAAGAARGLAYLHEDCHPRIIHRDIKSSNILLDSNFEAKVADFGLAKLALDTNTHVSTRVMGTFGYLAPEYAASGKLTEKSDVFSFGVVLLELITGRKPVDASQPLGDESLVEWARPLLAQALENENFEGLVDPRLEKNFVASEMFRMIEAAAACVRHSASKRPKMSQVVRALDSMDELSDLTNGMKPGQSEIFDSREQSAQIRMFQRMAFGSQEYSSDFFNNSQSSWRS